jgi:hypothetical protein
METTDIAGQIIRTFESVVANGEAVERFVKETESEIHRLWTDNAELRDEINAVANRVESLTRAVMADPADVARAIVNDANRSTLREVRDDG